MKKTTLILSLALAISLAALPATGLAGGPYPRKGSYNCYTGGYPDSGITIKKSHKYKSQSGGGGKFATSGHKINFKTGPDKDLKGTFGPQGDKDYALHLHYKDDPSLGEECLHN